MLVRTKCARVADWIAEFIRRQTSVREHLIMQKMRGSVERKTKWPGRVASAAPTPFFTSHPVADVNLSPSLCSLSVACYRWIKNRNPSAGWTSAARKNEDTHSKHTTAAEVPLLPYNIRPAVLKQIEHEFHSSIAIDSWKREKTYTFFLHSSLQLYSLRARSRYLKKCMLLCLCYDICGRELLPSSWYLSLAERLCISRCGCQCSALTVCCSNDEFFYIIIITLVHPSTVC